MPRRRTWWLRIAGASVGICALLVGLALLRPGEYSTILQADRVVVYEGLPHPDYEAGVYRDELKKQATVHLEGFDFYRNPLTLSNEDSRALVAVLGASETYQSYGGEKKCGGFHPDYAVEWEAGGTVYRCLICFGCSEARVGRPERLRFYDLQTRPDARSVLKDLLKRYRVSRPPHEYFGLTPVDD